MKITMKLLAAFFGVLLQSSTIFAMNLQTLAEYTMPTAAILKARLFMFKSLVDSTDLIADVAERKLKDCNVVWAVDLAIYDYLIALARKGYPDIELKFCFEKLDKQRPRIIYLLLQEVPEVIQILKKTTVFKPIQTNWE